MKITINGSAKELTKLAIALSCMENEEKKTCFPPLLTKLVEDEKINELAGFIRNADKENASQVEAAEQKTNQEILEKQMKLLSNTSENCAKFDELVAHVPALTHAMIEIQSYLRQDPV
ncbi:MAG: hypothetical protein K1W18_02865 [Oscillospiraceae bacterium]